jgi:hypothetical protein
VSSFEQPLKENQISFSLHFFPFAPAHQANHTDLNVPSPKKAKSRVHLVPLKT